MALNEEMAANLLRRMEVTDRALGMADTLKLDRTHQMLLINQLYIMQAMLAMNDIDADLDASRHEAE